MIIKIHNANFNLFLFFYKFIKNIILSFQIILTLFLYLKLLNNSFLLI
jgi:hypothetical protein